MIRQSKEHSDNLPKRQHSAEQNRNLSVDEISVRSNRFSRLLELRSNCYKHARSGLCESIDNYSHHFVASCGNKIVGALRVTCHIDGELESCEAYPKWVFDEFGLTIGSASRMCVHPDFAGRSTIPQLLTRLAWQTVLQRGIRIDVTKARLKAVPFYLRMGYVVMRDSLFQFDRWNAKCVLIAHPADPQHPSPMSSVFNGICDPCCLCVSENTDLFIRDRREAATYIRQLTGRGRAS